MSSWIDRLQAERDELNARRMALLAFIMSPAMASIDRHQQILLDIQYDLMQAYENTLDGRLALARGKGDAA